MQKQLLTILIAISINVIAQIPVNIPSSGLISYYAFNNNGNDLVSSSVPITNSGISCPDRFGNTNSAYQFNGNNLIKYNGSNPMGLIGNSYQNFTINYWVNFSSNSSISLGAYGWGYYLGLTSTNKISFSYIDNSSIWNYNYSNSSVTFNDWKMITIRKTGSILSIFIDKVLDNTITLTSNIQNYTPTNCWIGANGQDLNSYTNGKLDDISIYNKSLTQSGIDSLFNGFVSSCTPNLTNGLIAHYPFTGNANDLSGNNLNGVVNGAILSTDRFGNANSAYEYDGINDYIQVNDNALLDITGNITISAWILPYTLNSSRIVDKTTVNSTDAYMTDIGGLNTQKRIRFICAGNQPVSSDFISANNWYHIVVTYDGSNAKFYNNGLLINTIPQTGSSVSNNNPLRFGANSLLNADWFHGKIDDISIYNRALTACDVDSMFNLPNPNSTGITLNNKDINPIIYPNPFINSVKIDGLKTASISIYNTTGALIKQQNFIEQPIEINLNEVCQGIYFMNIKTDKGIIVKKIIKE